MIGYRVVLWRRDRRGGWHEVATYPAGQVAQALADANARNTTNSELFVVLPFGDIPTT